MLQSLHLELAPEPTGASEPVAPRLVRHPRAGKDSPAFLDGRRVYLAFLMILSLNVSVIFGLLTFVALSKFR